MQGSGIGPKLFTICIIDLQPLGASNHICKYADDSSLLVPEKCDIDISEVLENLHKWADENKLKINLAKTKQLVFLRPNVRNYFAPSELPGLERILCAKLLGEWLQHDLGMRKHIDYVLHICNQRTYLLTQLKRQGLSLAQLQSVFDAIILSRVVYAVPAWRGYLSAADTECLQSCLSRLSDEILSQMFMISMLFLTTVIKLYLDRL